MMLVDGDTLDKQRHGSKHEDEQAPVFHTLGLCMKQGSGDVQHVVYSQPGFSSLYKQPSLNATLRPADLSQVEWKVCSCFSHSPPPFLWQGLITSSIIFVAMMIFVMQAVVFERNAAAS